MSPFSSNASPVSRANNYVARVSRTSAARHPTHSSPDSGNTLRTRRTPQVPPDPRDLRLTRRPSHVRPSHVAPVSRITRLPHFTRPKRHPSHVSLARSLVTRRALVCVAGWGEGAEVGTAVNAVLLMVSSMLRAGARTCAEMRLGQG
jgi:hypothetical protein